MLMANAGKLLLGGSWLQLERFKNQPLPVSATWDATHPTLSQSSFRDSQPHSSGFRAPAAHGPSSPTLHWAPPFWAAQTQVEECRGGQHLPPHVLSHQKGMTRVCVTGGGNKSWLGPQQTLAPWHLTGDLVTLVVPPRQEHSSCMSLPHTVAGALFKGLTSGTQVQNQSQSWLHSKDSSCCCLSCASWS